MKYTPHTIACGEGVYSFHDITVFDSNLLANESLRSSRKLGKKVLQNSALLSQLPAEKVELIKVMPALTFEILYCQYRNERSFGRDIQNEPPWVNCIDPRNRKAIRAMWTRLNGTEPCAIVPTMRYHGIGYVVEDDDLVMAASHTFNLSRLRDIRQLAYLHDPLTENSAPSVELHFMHSRWVHSLDVAVIASLVVANNPELMGLKNHIRTAAISHDALTPAGGDSTKLIDPVAFDEDANYHRLLHGEMWVEFSKKYKLNSELLASMVQGNGIGGKVLDLADKSAYIARDLENYLIRGGYNGPREYALEYEGMKEIVKKNKNLCALWRCAKVVGDKLVISDADTLYQFLKLRALLFKGLYYNPRSRKLEAIVTKKIIAWAYHTGKLTLELLLRWTDLQLEAYLRHLIGFDVTFLSTESDVEEYGSLEEANRREEELRSDESVLVAVDDFAPSTKCGTRSFAVQKGGKVSLFADAYPYRTKKIRDMIRIKQRKYLVYIVKMDCLNITQDQALRKELKEFNSGKAPFQIVPDLAPVKWEQRKGEVPKFILTG